MLCYAMLCYVMLCYVCYVMLCYVMLHILYLVYCIHNFYKLSYNIRIHMHYFFFFVGESVPQMKEALGQEMKEVKEGNTVRCVVCCVW